MFVTYSGLATIVSISQITKPLSIFSMISHTGITILLIIFSKITTLRILELGIGTA